MKTMLKLTLIGVLLISAACSPGIATDVPGALTGTGNPNPNPGVTPTPTPGGFPSTGSRLLIDFPVDAADPNKNGLLLEGVAGRKTTLRIRFRPGHQVLAGGQQGDPVTLTRLTVTASENFGGVTLAPFITEANVVNNEASFLITVPPGRVDKTHIITITGIATDSGNASIVRSNVLLVNTTTILTTNPEYDVTNTIQFPDSNPLTVDTINLHQRSTLNSDLWVTGVAELVDNPPGRFHPEDLPFYVPVFGKIVLGGGNNPHLDTYPLTLEFPQGTVRDFPGSLTVLHDFCLGNDITPNLTEFLGHIGCVTGEIPKSELSGLPGLLFPLGDFSQGHSTTPILPTDPSRGLQMETTQVTTATDVNENTIDVVHLRIFDATTQADQSLKGKLQLIFSPAVDPSEPPVIVDFTTEPVDTVNLLSLTKPVTFRIPANQLDDVGSSVITKGVRVALHIAPDFQFNYGVILPGGFASTALNDLPVEGTSFSLMTFPPREPTDPAVKMQPQHFWILGTPGHSTNIVATFTPGTTHGTPSSVANATISVFGDTAANVVLAKTALTATDFVNNVANIGIHIADGVNITQTTIVPIKIEGTDSDGVAFKSYTGLTLKRIGPQPPLPQPPPFEFVKYNIAPDFVLSTADILKFRTVVTSTYGATPGTLELNGTATLIDPPGIDWVVPAHSIYNVKTREVTTLPIETIVPQGALPDVSGVAGIRVVNEASHGFFSPDLKFAWLESSPGGQSITPNGIVYNLNSVAYLKLIETPDATKPQINLAFSPNPVIWNITPSNQSTLTIQFVPGQDAQGSPTTLSSIKCTADHNFGVLTTTDFVEPVNFTNNVATFVVTPPASYNGSTGDHNVVYCEITDSAGNTNSGAAMLVQSNSPFQSSSPLPDFDIELFNSDPDTNTNTPPPGVFPFRGDGVRNRAYNQMITPGLLAPTVTGLARLTHWTKTDSLNPPAAHWEPYTSPIHHREFIVPFTGTFNMRNLTFKTVPTGVGDTCHPGDFGLVQGGPICFPAGEVTEDVMYQGRPSDLITPVENYALYSSFSSDLRTMVSTTALSCGARTACDGVNLCPFPNPNYAVPCAPGDVNPNPFGVATLIFGLPPFPAHFPVPNNGFGMGQQVP